MNHYYLLGRSGLRVSRLALGTMNFGVDGFHAAYGKTEEEAEPIFRRYVEAGGNLIDTADFYTAGESERILGRLIATAGNREPGVASVVIGASSPAQLDVNLGALDFDLPADARRRLDEASAPPVGAPYSMFTPQYQSWIVSPGLGIGDKPATYAPPVFNGAAG